ncbi:hypothetical protein TIFTF001_017491 [Ficus carica]|uniref:Uncharacterized protein n=1 Tax=Ficus carica TaxID=3494 RepID=A0AA88A842_FICCA|nr:hypothetical protein TIFTF001_017491 [Ficus carica]
MTLPGVSQSWGGSWGDRRRTGGAGSGRGSSKGISRGRVRSDLAKSIDAGGWARFGGVHQHWGEKAISGGVGDCRFRVVPAGRWRRRKGGARATVEGRRGEFRWNCWGFCFL